MIYSNNTVARSYLEIAQQAVKSGDVTDPDEFSYLCSVIGATPTTYTVNHHKSNGDGTYTLADTFENVNTTVGNNTIALMDYDGFYARQDADGFVYAMSENSSENLFDIYYEIKTVEVQNMAVSYLGNDLDGVYFTADSTAKINLTQVTLDGAKAYSYTAFDVYQPLTLKNIDTATIKAAGYNLFRIDIRTDDENDERLIEDLVFKYGGGAAGVNTGWGGSVAAKAALANKAYLRLYDASGKYVYYYSLAEKLINAGEWYTLEFTLPDPQNTENGVAIELYNSFAGRTIYLKNPTFAKDYESVKITAGGTDTAFSFGKAHGSEDENFMSERFVAGRSAIAYTCNHNGWGLTLLDVTADDIASNSYAKFRIDVYSPNASAYDLSALQHTVSVRELSSAFSRPIFDGSMGGNVQYYRVYDAEGNPLTALTDTVYGQWFTIEYSVSTAKATLNNSINGFLAHLYGGSAGQNKTVYFSNPRFIKNDVMSVSCETASVAATFGTTSQTSANVRFENVGTVAGKDAFAMYGAPVRTNAASVTLMNLSSEQITENNLQSFKVKVYSASKDSYDLSNLFFKVYEGATAREYRLNSGNLTGNNYAAMYAADGSRIYDAVYGEWLTLEFNFALDNGATAYGGISVELYSAGTVQLNTLNAVYFAQAEITSAGDAAGA